MKDTCYMSVSRSSQLMLIVQAPCAVAAKNHATAELTCAGG